MEGTDVRESSFRPDVGTSDKGSKRLHIVPGSYSGRALEVLLDFAELFGAVSLFETASGLYLIAADLPCAYLGFACLCSFVAISNLHAVGSALEAFEGEYTKNWAVLGVNWTCNFCGVLLFLVSRRFVGDTSMPWLSFVAPLIQTVVLLYALAARIGDLFGKARMFLVAMAIVLMIACVVVPHYLNDIETKRCNNSSVFDVSNGCRSLHLSSDCFDFTDAADFRFIAASPGGTEHVLFENAQLQMVSSTGSDESLLGGYGVSTDSSSCEFLLTNDFPEVVVLGGVLGNAIALLFLFFVLFSLLVGGSFAVLILTPHFETVVPRVGRVLTIAVVLIGWPVIYPAFEIYLAIPRLIEWSGCLWGGIVQGQYEFDAEGSITMPGERDDEVPNCFKWRGSRSESTRTLGMSETPDNTDPPSYTT